MTRLRVGILEIGGEICSKCDMLQFENVSRCLVKSRSRKYKSTLFNVAETVLEPTPEPTPGPTGEPTPEPTPEPTQFFGNVIQIFCHHHIHS